MQGYLRYDYPKYSLFYFCRRCQLMKRMEEFINEFLVVKGGDINHAKNCSKFLDYINYIGKADEPSSITKSDLVDSIGYPKNKDSIKAVNTMVSYLESIKSLYLHLNDTYGTVNLFDSVGNYRKFKEEITEKYSLEGAKEREYLPAEVIIDLLKYFDNELNAENNDNNFQIIKLFVKLTLIAPAKRQVIANIRINDFSEDFRILKINGFFVDIPNALRRDLKYAIGLKSEQISLDTKLFEYIYDKKFKDEIFNKPLADVLKAIGYLSKDVSTFSVEEVMNSSIRLMIKKDINTRIIAKINGHSIATIGKRILKYGVSEDEDDKKLNLSMAGLEYYKYI